VPRAGRLAALTAAVLCLTAADARADWLITPFIGATFGGQTIHVDLEQGAGSTQVLFGGAGAWLTDGVIGFEADFAYAPRYFERDTRAGLVTNSYLYTLTGNVIVTLPLSITRESLRPYVTGGLGVMDGHIEDFAKILPELFDPHERASAALNVGAGVIGFVTRNTGARFDLRHVRSLARDESLLTGVLRTKLSFWRATAGVTLRY
jgi:hypothetical protein